MNILVVVLAVSLLLSACAGTPIGEIDQAHDMVWQEHRVDKNYQEVYRNISEGFRNCIGASQIVGIPESYIYTDINKAHFDVFYPHPAGFGSQRSKSSFPMGMIDVADDNGISKVRVGGLKRGFGKLAQQLFPTWLNFANGKFDCVIPEK